MGQARWEAECGATLFEMLVTVAVGALLVFAVLYAANSFNHSLRQSATLQAATTGAETLIDSLERDAHSGQAIFTPARDVAGNDNTDGHEVAFYARDTSGAGHFWSYCYKGGAGKCVAAQPANTIAMYHYAWSELPQNGGSGATLNGTIAENVTAFRSQTVPASSLLDATLNPISASYFRQIGITNVVDVPRQMGFPGVVGGNRVTIVSLSTVAGPRVVHLMASAMTTRRLAIVGTYTPPPNALTIPIGANLHFWSPLAPQQSATIAESNYGTRITNPAQIYTIIGTSCPPYTTWNPNSVLTPMNNGTGDAQLNVTPIKQVESGGEACGYTFADNVGQTTNLGVAIDPTQPPSAAYVSGALVRNSTITFSVQESNYVPSGSPLSRGGVGGFTAVADGVVCTGATIASVTSNGGPATSGYGPESESWTVTAGASVGTCSITFTDTYGQTATASVTIAGPAPTPTPGPPCMLDSSTVVSGPTDQGSVGSGVESLWLSWTDVLGSTYAGTFYAPQAEISGGFINGPIYQSYIWARSGHNPQGTLAGTCPLGAPPTPTPVNQTLYTCDPSLVGTSYFNSSGGITTYALDPSCGGRPITTPAPPTATPAGGCGASNPSNSQYPTIGGPCDNVQCVLAGSPYAPQMGWADYTQGNWWGPCSPPATPTPAPTTTSTNCPLGCGPPVTPTPVPTCASTGGPLPCPTSPPETFRSSTQQRTFLCAPAPGCFSGARVVTNITYFESTNGGASWTNCGGEYLESDPGDAGGNYSIDIVTNGCDPGNPFPESHG